jgi:hypothetical protein
MAIAACTAGAPKSTVAINIATISLISHLVMLSQLDC